jgi:hypothetical protein
MGKSRLVRRVLADRHVMHAAASAPLVPTAAGLLADLLEQPEGAPHDLVRRLRSGAADVASDDRLQVRGAGRRLGELAAGATLLVEDLELLTGSELELLLEGLAASGLAYVLTSREPVPGPVEVAVGAWGPEDAGRLLDQVLPRATAELRHAVLERAGDCPLYVEQCAQLLLENGAVSVDEHGTRLLAPDRLREVPSSMRLFVSSRLDLLPALQRDVLGVAAVLGSDPDLRLLEHLTGEHAPLVERLVEKGFLRWVPGAFDQPTLRFSHALVRDVAYETQLRSRRVQVHRAAAEWYAVLPVAQVLEAQAYHLESAARLERPDCELLRRTVAAMVLFARSIEEERTRTSKEVLLRARELAEGRDECGVDLLGLELATSAVQFLLGEEDGGRDAAERAMVLAVERGDSAATAEARLQLGRSWRFVDEQQAQRHLDEAAAAYELAGDRSGTAKVEVERAIQAEHQRGLAQYVEHLESAYQEAMRSGDIRLQAFCAQELAVHHAFASGLDSFVVWSQRAREVSRADDVGVEPRLDLASGALAMYGLAPASGVEAMRRALAASRDLGLEHVYCNALVGLGDLLVLSGRLDEADVVVAEARAHAARKPTPWMGLQLDLLEARLLLRQGRPGAARETLEAVADHELAATGVMRRDLAEARAWVALERGHLAEARAQAADAIGVDEELGERVAPLRPRLAEVVATVASGDTVALGTIAELRRRCRETGLTTIAQLANRWLCVEELTHGWTVDLHGLEEVDVIEARALDLEIEALSQRRWELLAEAAQVWAELGTTVWQARALLWHSELTGTPSDAAQELLAALEAPDGLADALRAQVRGLR